MKKEVKTQAAHFRGTIQLKKSDVPVGNTAAVNTLMEGNEDILEFTNYMKLGEKFPAFPYGLSLPFIMTKEWAESYAQKVNTVPAPMYIAGHEDSGIYKGRAIPGGYVVGAKVTTDENGDDVLAIRNFFKKADTDTTTELINQTLKEIKAGMLSTSIGDIERQEWIYLSEPDENGYDEYVNVTESVKAQSNAIVEHDMTGSDADIISTSFKQGDNPDENNDKGKNMEKTVKEMLLALKNNFLSGNLTPEDLSTGLGISILNVEQKSSLKRLEEAEKKLGMPVDKYLEQVEEDKANAFTSLKEASLKTAFEQDDVREIATSFFKLEEGTQEEIDNEVNRLKELGAVQKAQSLFAKEGNINLGGEDTGKDVSENYGKTIQA